MRDFGSRAVRVFKALSDPTRYKIICMLVGRGELGCGDFDEQFTLSKPAMSHHYRILENADLLIARKEGTHIYVRVNSEVLESFLPGFGKNHVGLEELEVD